MVRQIYDGEIAYYDERIKELPDLPETNLALEIPPFPDAPFDREALVHNDDARLAAIRFGSDKPLRCRFRVFAAKDENFRKSGSLFLVRGVCPCGKDRYTLFERVATVDPRTVEVDGGCGMYSEECRPGDPMAQLNRPAPW